MGIRGTVRRSTDGHFVHCNVDTDVIVWENPHPKSSPLYDPMEKPPELYDLIENFCLGSRRLELFGRKRNVRKGWLTVGNELSDDSKNERSEGSVGKEMVEGARAYNKEELDDYFAREQLESGSNLVPTTAGE